MWSRIGGGDTQSRSSRRQLPITKSTHKAGVVGDAFMRAVFAALDVSAERCGAAGFDRRHDLQLVKAYVAGVGFAPRCSVVAKDIRDLQNRSSHDGRTYAGGRMLDGFSGIRRSSGLVICRMVFKATRV